MFYKQCPGRTVLECPGRLLNKTKPTGGAIQILLERKRSKSELITELASLRLKVADLERFRLQHEQTERDLTHKRKEYRTIFDSAPARVIHLDSEGRFLRVNKTHAEIFGLSPGEVIGKSLYDFFPAEQAAQLVNEHREIVGTGNPRFGIIERINDTDGKTRWFRLDKIPYHDKNGDIIGVTIFGVDITDQKKAEEALQEAEERFRHFMEHVPIYVFFKDDKIRSIQLSRNYEKMLGRPIEDLIGKTMDITDRKLSEAAMQENIRKLRKLLGNTIQVISSMIKAKAPFTADHQIRVADLARTIAKTMGLTPDRIEGIRVAGSLHDLGMIGIPGEILSSPRRLTDYEFELVKTHPTVAYDILKDVDFPWPIAHIIVQHHERIDGSGYPGGIQGEAMFLEARILAVADVVESIASHRPYRPAAGIDEALEIIMAGRGTLFDPVVVDACVQLFREMGYQLKED